MEEEAKKYRIAYDGQEAYTFIMSKWHILGLFAHCEGIYCLKEKE